MKLSFVAFFALVAAVRGEAPRKQPIASASLPYISFVPFTTTYQHPDTAGSLDTLAINLQPRRDDGGHFILSIISCPAELAKDPWLGYKRADKVMQEMMRFTDLKPDFFYINTLDDGLLPSGNRCIGSGIYPHGSRN